MEDGLPQVLSSLRFCEYPDGKPAALADQIEACMYTRSRPFSGRDLTDRQHPWCHAWYDAANLNQITSAARHPRYGLYCPDHTIPSWCAWTEGMGIGPSLAMLRRQGTASAQNRTPESDEDEYFGGPQNPEFMPVRGVYCRRRRQ